MLFQFMVTVHKVDLVTLTITRWKAFRYKKFRTIVLKRGLLHMLILIVIDDMSRRVTLSVAMTVLMITSPRV